MNTKLKNLLFKTWPILVILSLNLVIFKQNYIHNTQLLGWDNLVPEFNPWVNIQRSIFAVWQEYQGLGLLGGMGHASDLMHELILLILSFALPLNILRYIWVFLMLSLGALGTYFFTDKVILSLSSLNRSKNQFIALLSGVFYIFNLATVQTFYVPFEAFIAHFAALPWLLLTSVLFYQKPSRKNGFILAAVLFLSAPASYIPTLFVVYFISISILIGVLILANRQKESIKSGIKLFLIIVAVNAFWLLPFSYFTLNNASITISAKINQMSTETVFLQNKTFGNISDVMLLKGFWFNNVDPNLKGNFTLMLAPWRDNISQLPVTILGFLLFGIIIIGFILSIKRKTPILLGFAIIFFLAFSMLAIATPPFSWLDIILRKIPLFNEAFRFPFTKFSVLLSLTYSIFFAIGAGSIILRLKVTPILKKFSFYLFAIIFLVLPVLFTLPILKGNLFYSKETITVPGEYFQLFDYFKNQDQNTRIANFPQYTFWGWSYYTWGYGGSGFLWYGIKQPILDRAFDVWSKTDENYYWEISNALYSKNLQAFEAVLNKYQINWLIVDKNVFNPTSSKTLFIPELNSLITQIPSIQKTKSFGHIDVYKVSLKDTPKSFVFSASDLSSSNGYQWGNFDKAYLDLGNYISSDNPDFYYPFRSLFSNKNQADKEFSVKNGGSLTVSAKLDSSNNLNLNIPSLATAEDIVPATLVMEKTSSNLTLSVLIQTPQVSLVNGSSSRVIYAQNAIEPLFIIPQNYPGTINVNINGVKNFAVNPSKPQSVGTSFLSLKQENIITASDSKFKVLQTKTINPSDIISAIGINNRTIKLSGVKANSFIEVKIPKINDGYESFEKSPSKDLISHVKNCDNFNNGPVLASITSGNMLELTSQNSTACISFYIPTVIHNEGYALFVVSQNKLGRGLHTWVLNENEKNAPIDTYLDEDKNTISSFIIPPAEDFGRAYSLHFDNISITNDKTINDLGNVSLYAIPYNFLTSIKISDEKIVVNTPSNQSLYVNHPNEAYYEVNGITKNTLVLSQSYDKGWHAYALKSENILNRLFPFIGGNELENHVLINNWENGWVLDSKFDKDNRIIIVYLPQYLEFIGFMAVFIVIILMLRLKN
jgi:hypothetical protein